MSRGQAFVCIQYTHTWMLQCSSSFVVCQKIKFREWRGVTIGVLSRWALVFLTSLFYFLFLSCLVLSYSTHGVSYVCV